MAEVNYLIQNFINQHEIFTNGLLVYSPTEIFDYDHNSVQKLQ